MFLGFAINDSGTIRAAHQVVNSSSVPTDPDSNPTYRIYGPSGLVTSGSLSTKKETGSITGATNASPIVITSASHGLQTGMRVTVASVGGNTAANGTFNITVVNANTFSLDSSTGNSTYTSGGTWSVTGLYDLQITPTAAGGYAAGSFYSVRGNDVVSSTTKQKLLTFGVV
jgi:hypothetical protein